MSCLLEQNTQCFQTKKKRNDNSRSFCRDKATTSAYATNKSVLNSLRTMFTKFGSLKILVIYSAYFHYLNFILVFRGIYMYTRQCSIMKRFLAQINLLPHGWSRLNTGKAKKEQVWLFYRDTRTHEVCIWRWHQISRHCLYEPVQKSIP